jgi:hypothetical protein
MTNRANKSPVGEVTIWAFLVFNVDILVFGSVFLPLEKWKNSC